VAARDFCFSIRTIRNRLRSATVECSTSGTHLAKAASRNQRANCVRMSLLDGALLGGLVIEIDLRRVAASGLVTGPFSVARSPRMTRAISREAFSPVRRRSWPENCSPQAMASSSIKGIRSARLRCHLDKVTHPEFLEIKERVGYLKAHSFVSDISRTLESPETFDSEEKFTEEHARIVRIARTVAHSATVESRYYPVGAEPPKYIAKS
jgi:hypothetical protein